MPRRATRTVPTLILHGLDGSGPDHWQRWLAAELTQAGRDVRMPELSDPSAPQMATWLAEIRDAMQGLEPDGFDVVAHSLGAVAWLHHSRVWAADPSTPRPARVALVAPPAPDVVAAVAPSFVPIPLDIDTVRKAADGTVLVGGDDDPHCPAGIAATYGTPLKMATTVIPDGGHLNTESGFGPWPAILDWCGRDNLAFRA